LSTSAVNPDFNHGGILALLSFPNACKYLHLWERERHPSVMSPHFFRGLKQIGSDLVGVPLRSVVFPQKVVPGAH
jgi:hypothetical protein